MIAAAHSAHRAALAIVAPGDAQAAQAHAHEASQLLQRQQQQQQGGPRTDLKHASVRSGSAGVRQEGAGSQASSEARSATTNDKRARPGTGDKCARPAAASEREGRSGRSIAREGAAGRGKDSRGRAGDSQGMPKKSGCSAGARAGEEEDGDGQRQGKDRGRAKRPVPAGSGPSGTQGKEGEQARKHARRPEEDATPRQAEPDVSQEPRVGQVGGARRLAKEGGVGSARPAEVAARAGEAAVPAASVAVKEAAAPMGMGAAAGAEDGEGTRGGVDGGQAVAGAANSGAGAAEDGQAEERNKSPPPLVVKFNTITNPAQRRQHARAQLSKQQQQQQQQLQLQQAEQEPRLWDPGAALSAMRATPSVAAAAAAAAAAAVAAEQQQRQARVQAPGVAQPLMPGAALTGLGPGLPGRHSPGPLNSLGRPQHIPPVAPPLCVAMTRPMHTGLSSAGQGPGTGWDMDAAWCRSATVFKVCGRARVRAARLPA